MPKDATRDFIINNESGERNYYSGFSGLLDPNGDTRLFVTLRCMQIEGESEATAYRLYAGGGLLKDSQCQAEWEETEAKMNTMRQLFKHI
jgi:isochorismate synthase